MITRLCVLLWLLLACAIWGLPTAPTRTAPRTWHRSWAVLANGRRVRWALKVELAVLRV